ncbi:hypothetical protein [Rhizobium lusitanum]|uniref:hypothetical protein n=1 Tax=Rhizobium lusitanum TaxID=293958 RepID=UPI00195D47E5|nr:hypothetical protein [Rhizobium lusitanum]MBM7048361.1 hypothetical protein [Rhizobium lusitanum]
MTQADADNALAEILREAVAPDNDRLANLTLGDALRIPAVANLIVGLVNPDRSISADPDELHVAADVAADRALAIATRLAHEVSMRRASNIVRLGDAQTLDADAAQLLADLAGIGALVVAEFIIERRQRR